MALILASSQTLSWKKPNNFLDKTNLAKINKINFIDVKTLYTLEWSPLYVYSMNPSLYIAQGRLGMEEVIF